MIERIGELGPTAAPLTTAAGFAMHPDLRNKRGVRCDLFGRFVR